MNQSDIFKDFIPSNDVKLDELLKFTAVIDKMTSVIRRTTLLDKSRLENDAEHSWHIAMMALFFKDYFVEKVDVHHAVELLLMHDLVEIYAGDTFAYDVEANKTKKDREAIAAQKIADLLPKEYSVYYLSCYQEFEDKFTSEAKYADCMDKLQPFLHNALTEGFTWKNANPPTVATLVYKRMSILKDFMPEVYLWVEKSIKHAIQNKWLVDK